MGWNRVSSKSIEIPRGELNSVPEAKAGVGVGAPVSTMQGYVGRGYRDAWDIQKAHREGMQKATWVFRCIDAISGNQARLPVMLRKGNSPEGEIVRRGDHPLLSILNTKSNEGENSFVFRYRLSAQMLMSSRGVFIEIIRSRAGDVIALQLLPPDYTSPIPSAKKFVEGYEVALPGQGPKILSPDKVVWMRRPHPLNPYLSITPMESAGMAIEIENLAKVYNRNFLLNDGRPGGLLVVKSDMDEDDKDELRSRFRGNLNKVGGTSVISSADGVDYVDTGSSPRDASYTEMRQITKEEILAAFGVPESVIGNAAGRTFSNAAEEVRVFWMETMQPHLEIMARAMDELDELHYVDFDTSQLPAIIAVKQEKDRFLKEELTNGAISFNEYREGTGRKKVDSDLADSLLANPNLTPIGNTEKPYEAPAPLGAPGAPGAPVPGAPVPGAPVPGAPEAPPAPTPEELAAQIAATELPEQPGTGFDAEGRNGGVDLEAPAPKTVLSRKAALEDFESKTLEVEISEDSLSGEEHDDWEAKAAQVSDRWTEILSQNLERFFDRQERVVTEKALGAKSRRSLGANSISIDQIFDLDIWNKQLLEDVQPLLSAILSDGSELSGVDTKALPKLAEVKELLDQQMERILLVNSNTKKAIEGVIITVKAMKESEDRLGTLKVGLAAVFADLMGSRRKVIAETEAQTAINAGVFLSALKSGSPGRKVWVSKSDESVRPAHRELDNDVVSIGDAFNVGGVKIRFPGDPLAPAALTINCRCKLRFTPGK
jgi:HK97 family phage portal protein